MNKLTYFLIPVIARFPRIIGFLISRVTPATNDDYYWFLWNLIDHLPEPETSWNQLYVNNGLA